MRADRYLKVILTMIAAELLWVGMKTGIDPVSAQAGDTRVVITGIQLDAAARTGYLPVAILGNVKEIPVPLRTTLEPANVRVNGPVQVETRRPLKIEADRPLKVEADRPLKVENVRYTPGDRPGD
jgi:hypothetical protein